MPVYFAAANGGPDGTGQYAAAGPSCEYAKQGAFHDNAIDYTDKVSTAPLHKISVSKSSITFREDGGMSIATDHTNPVAAPYNVNLPYSTSHHMLNDLSTVIFPGQVVNPSLITDNPCDYNTLDVVSGLANAAFGLSCEVKADPGTVFNEITSKIGACCIKGYKTQCRYVYAK